MDLTHDDVLQILDVLDSTDVEYFELRLGDTVIVANRGGHPPPAAQPLEPAVPPPGPAATTPEPRAAQTAPAAPASDGLVDVTAPVVGVFYRAPEPGAAPFVELDVAIEEGATLGLVEVMKMFSSVTAPVAGSVAQVLVENGELVEFGQVLFRISPQAPA